MKRLLLTVCCTILISINSKAQLDTIPNAGFENWYYTPIWTIEAMGWQTNNSSIAAWNVVPDSVSYSGLLGLKIQKISYKGIIWSGFPLSNHPLTLDCFIKNGLNLGDTAIIRIHVYSSNVIVDSGYAEIYGGIGTNYLPFSFNISQNTSAADSCVITLEGGNIYMSSISFDDLSFTFPTSVEEQDEGGTWNIFPNPVRNKFTIYDLSRVLRTISEVEIYTLTGERVFGQQLAANNQQQVVIDISGLADGTYLLSVSDSKNRHNKLIIKN